MKFKALSRRVKTMAMLAGTSGLCAWVYLSSGDAESSRGEPRLGWEMFDDWQDFGQW